MSLQCLSAPTEFPGSSLSLIDHFLGPRLCLAKDAFILGTLSWAIIIKTNLFIHQHSLFWRRLLLLGQILVLGLGHRSNIQVDNELLGPRALQTLFFFKKRGICTTIFFLLNHRINLSILFWNGHLFIFWGSVHNLGNYFFFFFFAG